VNVALNSRQIRHLFKELDAELATEGVQGEIYVVGGAVMCVVLGARDSTQDVDALFLPSGQLRAAARRVARREGVDEAWLNDAAKGYLSNTGEFAPFLQLAHLTVLTATPEYLLAMKCLAMRLGPEFHDLADVRYLLRYLNIEEYAAALKVLQSFYPIERFPQKTLYVLEEILTGG
jgi:hypothetical protein